MYNNGYSELYHYGIQGQKWGVRRFQNYDGTLINPKRQKYRDSKIININSQNDEDHVSKKHMVDMGDGFIYNPKEYEFAKPESAPKKHDDINVILEDDTPWNYGHLKDLHKESQKYISTFRKEFKSYISKSESYTDAIKSLSDRMGEDVYLVPGLTLHYVDKYPAITGEIRTKNTDKQVGFPTFAGKWGEAWVFDGFDD